MVIKEIDINTFERNSEFYEETPLLLTVKNFDLSAIRKRYLESSQRSDNRTGSVSRREIGIGGIVSVVLSNGQIINQNIINKIPEPRGIASHSTVLAYSAENIIYVIGDTIRQIKHPWFSYIHTLDFDPSGERLLVSSSGFDLILEFDIHSLNCVYEWYAWENGYNVGFDSVNDREIILSRTPISSEDAHVFVVNDPTTQSIPTAMRAAFINSVVYDKKHPDKIVATLFHKGTVIEIDRKTGATSTKVSSLKTPHGGERLVNGYLVTSTGSGEVIVQVEEGSTNYSFKNLPGKPPEFSDKEWLQNTKYIGGNFITIDSNRTSFVIFNPEKKLIDLVPYDPDWAVQDMIHYTPSEDQIQLIQG